MTETPTEETVEETTSEIKPFTDEQDREIAYRSDANPAAAAGSQVRPAVVAPSAATGRRKEAIARVRIFPGTGKWLINGRTLEDYFPNKVHQQHVSDPFVTAGVTDSYDVICRIHGGGITGQAGALRLGIARSLNAVDEEASRPALKKAGMLTRDARIKERKKAGLKKARKAPQYSKR
ncbi:30S ribosomal protein S9 [Tessaracoccus antarcticus]|uniref:Small ribosomal subunit protein uS9 n=1 Tax=Tessaracoccus antarcticus TaxID=2479848 RepID=A0A3M0G137_9ACTN|nr:30S ribosomal protein S9 [Tessaracoccus antarcticus]RMB58328.1 30S ribosomal protein S9 [Tessaracoccus antarcticus]